MRDGWVRGAAGLILDGQGESGIGASMRRKGKVTGLTLSKLSVGCFRVEKNCIQTDIPIDIIG